MVGANARDVQVDIVVRFVKVLENFCKVVILFIRIVADDPEVQLDYFAFCISAARRRLILCAACHGHRSHENGQQQCQ